MLRNIFIKSTVTFDPILISEIIFDNIRNFNLSKSRQSVTEAQNAFFQN